MADHLNIKASQIHLYKTIPFYYQSRKGEFVLYKKSGDNIEKTRAVKTKHPQLFILKKDKEDALKELTSRLNKNLFFHGANHPHQFFRKHLFGHRFDNIAVYIHGKCFVHSLLGCLNREHDKPDITG